MGIFLFLLIFLALIILFTLSKGRQERKVEVRGLDGSSLIFTDSGITYAGGTGVKFFSADSIRKFSIEREGESFVVVISDGKEEVRVPVSPQEVKKLFRQSSPNTLEPLFPYLPVFTGVAAGLLFGSLLSHPVIVEAKEPKEEEEISPHEEESVKEFDLGNPPEDEFDYFDTGEWFDDDQL